MPSARDIIKVLLKMKCGFYGAVKSSILMGISWRKRNHDLTPFKLDLGVLSVLCSLFLFT